MVNGWTKLRNGSWGVRAGSIVAVGETIEVARRDGSVSMQLVTRVVWAGGGKTLCEVMPFEKANELAVLAMGAPLPKHDPPKPKRAKRPSTSFRSAIRKLTASESEELGSRFEPGEECAVGHEDDDGSAAERAMEVMGAERFAEVYEKPAAAAEGWDF